MYNLQVQLKYVDKLSILWMAMIYFLLTIHVIEQSNGTKTMIFDFWCFSATSFNNISAISWGPVLVVEEAGVPRENYRPWASNW